MKYILPLLLLLGLAACGQTPGDRALSGGLLGAGGGAAISGLTGGNAGTGALIGGVGGAGLGLLTTPQQPSYGGGYGHGRRYHGH